MKTLKTAHGLGVLVVAVLATHVQALGAQIPGDGLDGPLERHPVADEAIARLKSPYCPGLMLEVCTSYSGALLRDSIQELAREGLSTDELVEWMVARHGEEYLAYPRASGAGLLAWLIPPFAILLGLVVVVAALRYMRQSNPDPETTNIDLSSEDEDRLREAMKDMDSAEEPVF